MKYLLVSVFIACGLLTAAQRSNWTRRAPYDTSFVESYYDHYLHVTGVSILQSNGLTITGTDGNSYDYQPNTVFRFGMGLDYKIFSLEYTSQIDMLHKPDQNKGETKSTGLRLGITGRRLLFSALIQNMQGMYLNNASELDNGTMASNGMFPIRKDIEVTAVLGSVNYFFNHRNYSTMASLWQIDRQKKSAGSFTTGVTTTMYFINADSALRFYKPVGGAISPRVQKIANYLYGLNFGYTHNFIFFKKFFANLFLIPGVNLQYGEERLTDGSTRQFQAKPGLHGDIRMVIGYNGEHYYSGIHYANYFLYSKLQTNTQIDLYHEYIRLFIGRRFDMRTLRKK